MPDARKPNLLFIMTDQQRYDAMSCAGSTFVHTPNMDRLAREGVRFTNAVTPSPIRVPARVSILTGLPIHSTGCVWNPDAKNPDMCRGLPSFDQVLANDGYTADHVGKSHVPEPLRECYQPSPARENYRAYLARHGYRPVERDSDNPYVYKLSGQPYEPDPLDHGVRVAEHGHGHARVAPGLEFGRDTVPSEHSLSAMVADQTIETMKRLGNGPFSLSSSFVFPHDPLIVPRPFCDMVAEADMAVPDTFDDDRCNTHYRDAEWAMDEVEREHARLMMARYYAATMEVDHHIGRVLDALDELGLAGDTLVIFTSDHGDMLCDHGMMLKFVLYRGSVGVPLLMRMPGRIEAGRTVDEPVCLTDLHATIVDYLGVESPVATAATTESLRPWIDGDGGGAARIAFSQFQEWNVMAQTRGWKYVWSSRPDDVDMLFDLTSDPGEATNLVGANPDRARHMEPAEAMKRALVGWMEQTRHPWLDDVAGGEVR